MEETLGKMHNGHHALTRSGQATKEFSPREFMLHRSTCATPRKLAKLYADGKRA
jgi:hypothetical protein